MAASLARVVDLGTRVVRVYLTQVEHVIALTAEVRDVARGP